MSDQDEKLNPIAVATAEKLEQLLLLGCEETVKTVETIQQYDAPTLQLLLGAALGRLRHTLNRLALSDRAHHLLKVATDLSLPDKIVSGVVGQFDEIYGAQNDNSGSLVAQLQSYMSERSAVPCEHCGKSYSEHTMIVVVALADLTDKDLRAAQCIDTERSRVAYAPCHARANH